VGLQLRAAEQNFRKWGTDLNFQRFSCPHLAAQPRDQAFTHLQMRTQHRIARHWSALAMNLRLSYICCPFEKQNLFNKHNKSQICMALRDIAAHAAPLQI
jgi:hypothetical protein